MPLDKPPNNFEIEVNISDVKWESKDINIFYVFRTPFVKHGSFASLVLGMPISVFKELEDLLQQNQTPEINLEIWMTDPSIHLPGRKYYKRTKKIINKKYNILSIMTNEQQNPNNQVVIAKMILINPIFYSMGLTNGFNKIFKTTTAMSVLEEYESYLKSQYGPTSYEFIKIGEGENLNTYNYEQIMCKVSSDFEIPNHLLFTKKVFNSLSYYFFDDFRITEDKKADICGILTNLYNIDLFNEIDIHSKKWEDVQAIKEINTCPIFEPFSTIMKNTPRIVVRDKDTLNKRNDDPGTANTTQLQTVPAVGEIHQDRIISTTEVQLSQSGKRVSSFLNLYAPDSKDLANTRYELVQEQLKDRLRAFHMFEVHQCYPDIFQFDRKYNIDVNSKTIYNQVPVSIINIFRTENPTENKLFHGVRLKTIKFKTEV